MPTVITDNMNLSSLKDILAQFRDTEEVDVISTAVSPIELAILNGLQISNIVLQPNNGFVLFILTNGTIIQRQLNQISILDQASEAQLMNFENLGNGVIWPDAPDAEISLKFLLQEELKIKYNLQLSE